MTEHTEAIIQLTDIINTIKAKYNHKPLLYGNINIKQEHHKVDEARQGASKRKESKIKAFFTFLLRYAFGGVEIPKKKAC